MKEERRSGGVAQGTSAQHRRGGCLVTDAFGFACSLSRGVGSGLPIEERLRMAIGIRIKLPGITQEQFDKAHDHINPDHTSPEGLLFHASGPIDGGWGIIDFWESREDFDAFSVADHGRHGSGWCPTAGATRYQRVPCPRGAPPVAPTDCDDVAPRFSVPSTLRSTCLVAVISEWDDAGRHRGGVDTCTDAAGGDVARATVTAESGVVRRLVGNGRRLPRCGQSERTAASRSSSCAVATQIVVSAAP